MKIRNGFVSNSSSSSFIVIADGDIHPKKYNRSQLVIDKSFGKTEFGWGPEVIHNMEAKIIFSYLQARYMNKDGWIKMLERVVRRHLGVKKITWRIDIAYGNDGEEHAYIDHQSSGLENAYNVKMFDSEEKLKQFLFNNDSSINLDNDNKME